MARRSNRQRGRGRSSNNRGRGGGGGAPRGEVLSSAASNTPSSPLSAEMRRLLSNELLLETILSRGVADHINSKNLLQEYLFKAFSGQPALERFFVSIAQGLLDGLPASLNKRMPIVPGSPPGGDQMTILIWLCQWKVLNKGFGCHIDDDLVEMVLKAGANPNDTLANKTNALFFAVKNDSPKTVKLLLDAGINVKQLDDFGRTCLYNALEHPNPESLRLLLEHLPVSEMFPSKYPDGTTFQMSLPDYVLQLFVSKQPLTSWHNLGPPSADDLAEAWMLLHQRGARLTAEGSRVAMAVLGVVLASPNSHHPSIRNPDLFKSLGKTIIGVNIPEAVKPKLEEEEEEEEELVEEAETNDDEGECPICFNTFHKKVTLYCGHSYCRKCIAAYGSHENGGGSKACPTCRSQLCPELCSTDAPNNLVVPHLTLEQVLGLGRQASARRGPEYFSDEQVGEEAKAQGIYSMLSSYGSLRSKLVDQSERGLASTQAMNEFSFMPGAQGGRPVQQQGLGRSALELSATVPLMQGTDMTLCPSKGPVYVEILIQGVPILARISNHSIYSVFSRSVVNQLGLARIESLQSRQFVDTVRAKKLKNCTFTCLEPVNLTVGDDIEVTLHNAVEMAPDPNDNLFGVQLGQDFLHSGLWCAIDTEVSDGVMFRTVGESSWCVGGAAKESLRFYSHGGKMAKLPLIHFNPFVQDTFLAISLKENVTFEQCCWCCRTFPKGMKCCPDCEAENRICTYCDERCFRAAWKIHRTTCKGRS